MAYFIGYSFVDGNLYKSSDEFKMLQQDRKMRMRRIAPTHNNFQIYVDQFCWDNEITDPPTIITLD